MKKKHHHEKRHRNNGGGSNSSAPRPRPRPRARRSFRRAEPPDWKTMVAAIVGGAGSATVGGLVVNQKILPPEAVGACLIVGGGLTAYLAGGTARVVGNSVASAGAGQLALALMARQALKGAANQSSATQLATNQGGQPAAQLPAPASAAPPPAAPPPAVEPPRRSASGGGVVLDLFRDAATDLDMFEDEWRYGMRDDAGPVVIDLDEAA